MTLALLTMNGRMREGGEAALTYAAMGMSSEAGEINEILKKVFYHGHPMDEATKTHLKKELGDAAWYWVAAVWAAGFDPADVLATNIAKLRARYPEGFSTERSLNRSPEDL
jgi:NTP pyrophosphatase (non-canonical NTP hydrolase)